MSQPSREEVEYKYRDIIHAERPQNPAVLRRHPRMSIGDRAKIFAPFAALRGRGDQLLNEESKLHRQTKIELMDGQADILSKKLSKIEKGQRVSVIYFHPDTEELGYYLTLEGQVTAFDPVFKTIKLDKKTLSFDDIIDIYGEGIPEMGWDTERESQPEYLD